MNEKTKEYQIKDLSKLLGISKEMIRYKQRQDLCEKRKWILAASAYAFTK